MVNEGQKIPKVFSKESFEIWLPDRSGAFVAAFKLRPPETNSVTEKWSYKWGTIHPDSTWYFKIVLRLLIDMIAFHMELTPIGFQGSSLKKAFLRL